ncbi:MAG: hypothetical protein IDH49_04580 [Gammaproteobacteria bacterium]|nr:hypothetical protein [Gammaproteobacteria bacterium]
MLDLVRVVRIGFAVRGYLLWLLVRRLHLWPATISPGRKACQVLQGLGTTFIKLGQSLSLRRDLLPDEYVSAFQTLQDQVAPFSAAAAADREITTPFDMAVLNDIDRFHLVKDIVDRVPGLDSRAAYLTQVIRDKWIDHQRYIRQYGEDMPEIRDWKWGARETGKKGPARQ